MTIRAHIWRLREQGLSLRAIARVISEYYHPLSISHHTVKYALCYEHRANERARSVRDYPERARRRSMRRENECLYTGPDYSNNPVDHISIERLMEVIT